jgi:hypothetical protein
MLIAILVSMVGLCLLIAPHQYLALIARATLSLGLVAPNQREIFRRLWIDGPNRIVDRRPVLVWFCRLGGIGMLAAMFQYVRLTH